MREQLTSALKSLFDLSEKDALTIIVKALNAKNIAGLATLITSLGKTETNPKEIVQNLEDVIVQIAIKKHPTQFEERLCDILKEASNEPEITNSFKM